MPNRKRNYTEKPVESIKEVEETNAIVEEATKEPEISKAKVIKKVVNVNALNLRVKPDGNIKRILKKGQTLSVTRFNNVWDKVDSIDGEPAAGYVMSKFLMEKK